MIHPQLTLTGFPTELTAMWHERCRMSIPMDAPAHFRPKEYSS